MSIKHISSEYMSIYCEFTGDGTMIIARKGLKKNDEIVKVAKNEFYRQNGVDNMREVLYNHREISDI